MTVENSKTTTNQSFIKYAHIHTSEIFGCPPDKTRVSFSFARYNNNNNSQRCMNVSFSNGKEGQRYQFDVTMLRLVHFGHRSKRLSILVIA